MPVNKSKGNMYDWVTHTWSPIIGCEHQCKYCYVKAYRDQPAVPEMREDFPRLGKDRTIFVGHLCDMFGRNVPIDMITRVMAHCRNFDTNTYVFQTKNPERLHHLMSCLPNRFVVGTTIETNRVDLINMISTAPTPLNRAGAMKYINAKKFVTMEPILDFDIEPMLDIMRSIKPDFINIGADSKNNGLPEPTREKVLEFAERLISEGFTIRKKLNLDRLVKG